MYRVSGKQLLLLSLISALMASVIMACAQKAFNNKNVSIEQPVMADPSVASDEATTGLPAASASSTLVRMPPPIRSGVATTAARSRYGKTSGTEP